jgi:hypothetical protein
MRPMLLQVAYGDDEIVSKHTVGFGIQQDYCQKSTRFLGLNNQSVAICR